MSEFESHLEEQQKKFNKFYEFDDGHLKIKVVDSCPLRFLISIESYSYQLHQVIRILQDLQNEQHVPTRITK